MRGPSFSAEAGLYRGTGRYRAAGPAAPATGIAPQDAVFVVNEGPMECFPVTVDGKVTICCCDESGDHCQCTGIV